MDATTKKIGASAVVKQYHKIMEVVRNSAVMCQQGNDYRKDFDYAADIEFAEPVLLLFV